MGGRLRRRRRRRDGDVVEPGGPLQLVDCRRRCRFSIGRVQRTATAHADCWTDGRERNVAAWRRRRLPGRSGSATTGFAQTGVEPATARAAPADKIRRNRPRRAVAPDPAIWRHPRAVARRRRGRWRHAAASCGAASNRPCAASTTGRPSTRLGRRRPVGDAGATSIWASLACAGAGALGLCGAQPDGADVRRGGRRGRGRSSGWRVSAWRSSRGPARGAAGLDRGVRRGSDDRRTPLGDRRDLAAGVERWFEPRGVRGGLARRLAMRGRQRVRRRRRLDRLRRGRGRRA